jgi:hypothetical protein
LGTPTARYSGVFSIGRYLKMSSDFKLPDDVPLELSGYKPLKRYYSYFITALNAEGDYENTIIHAPHPCYDCGKMAKEGEEVDPADMINICLNCYRPVCADCLAYRHETLSIGQNRYACWLNAVIEGGHDDADEEIEPAERGKGIKLPEAT